jgi:hypothetical protein
MRTHCHETSCYLIFVQGQTLRRPLNSCRFAPICTKRTRYDHEAWTTEDIQLTQAERHKRPGVVASDLPLRLTRFWEMIPAVVLNIALLAFAS